jgi:glycosyltransferase involved in cell wall biosynthesis
MTPTPLLSFCIFTYNRKIVLTQVLDQILAIRRALPDGLIEIVVSDNCSTDGTPAMLRERYAADDVKLFVQSENVGACRNWLHAIKQSTGTYVWPYSDDDLLDVEGVVHMVRNHLQRAAADFYRVNFLAGWYDEVPRRRAMITQLGNCIDCDIIFPDMAALIPYCGTMTRGVIMHGNILKGDIIRACDFRDFLPLDTYVDHVEVMLKAFKHKRTALLHRCLMTLIVPKQGPRWTVEELPDGMTGTYIGTIMFMRRMVRLIDNGVLHPDLIELDGLLRTFKVADGQYITFRHRQPNYFFRETLAFVQERGRPLERADSETIGAYGGYLTDPAMKMLFHALQRFAECHATPLLERLLSVRDAVTRTGETAVWQTSSCQPYDAFIGREIDLSDYGIQDGHGSPASASTMTSNRHETAELVS